MANESAAAGPQQAAGDTSHLSGVMPQRAAMDALLADAAGLSKVPAKFDPAATYRVKLSGLAVLPSGAILRPISDVVVSGEVAELIRDKIAGAKKIG
ncbi:hypothetical protein BJ122_102267 [Rhodopseudomonas faecalis]|uniref:Uncharacterized protein n=1 Tax=Rhodopseudomonas faecalis TaxID=99655 RepID=A0A318TJI8_9BRAD|nr:hypothetical protein [Rhodopseudomonas faecalis]PYF05041.1 hypothetical protein BJ122_102267 [Rhodopseudomonas faecalis]